MSTTEESIQAPAHAAPTTKGGAVGYYIDDRLASASFTKRLVDKVFPDHWSFMLGEIALYSFIILLLTGTFLTLWYKPSMTEVIYNGSYIPLKGIPMSEAYASTLEISFDVRGGMLLRQIHHWAALFFIAAMVVHLLRVFFTGAYRKPREFNWLLGLGLLTLGLLAGFSGYSLPDDLLSGVGLKIASGIVQALPVIGTWALYFSPLLTVLMRSHLGHLFMDAHFVLAGYLFFWNILGIDPSPRKVPDVLRLGLVFAAAVFHGIFGFITFSSETQLGGGWFGEIKPSWLQNQIADQQSWPLLLRRHRRRQVHRQPSAS